MTNTTKIDHFILFTQKALSHTGKKSNPSLRERISRHNINQSVHFFACFDIPLLRIYFIAKPF